MSSCRECMGTGGIGRLETCSVCKGSGKSLDLVIENMPVAEVADMKYNRVQFYRATGDTTKPYLLPGTKLYTSPPELEELQATILQLSADKDTMRSKNNELNDTVTRQAAEIERLKAVTNFRDAVACVFDNLKMVAANTRDREWDDQLEELAEEVIEFAPEYKKEWKDLCKLQADLTSAIADKEAYGQNAIDLRRRLGKAIDMLYETSMAHSRIDKILLN